MPKNDAKASPDWVGQMDNRPGSSTAPEKGQGGGGKGNTHDFRGVPDSRPSSSTKSQSVKISGA